MALRPIIRYPGQTDVAAAYPHGKARNATSHQDGTGTPLERDWLNDSWGFLQSLLAAVGLTPSGVPDEVGASQYLESVRTLIERPDNFLTRVGPMALDDAPGTGDNLAVIYDPTLHFYLMSKGGTNGTHRAVDDMRGDTVADSGTVTSVRSAAFDPVANRSVLVGTGGGFVCHSTNLGTSWTDAVTPLGARDCVVWDPVHSLFLATRAGQSNVNTSPTAVTWTARTTTGSNSGGVAVNTVTGVGIAQVAAGPATAFNVSANGTTWGLSGGTIPNVASADTDVTGGNGASVVYLNGFFYNCARFNSGAEIRIHRSPDGVTWTLIKTITDTVGALGFPRIISDQFARTLYLVSVVSGTSIVWASFDGGVTWTDPARYFVDDVAAFAAAGGRLFMTDGAIARCTVGRLPTP